ncbi:Type 1 glutamine amidotransferase-like domain-containing protein [Microbacteriaceae bacterium VKM Ac-2855]|nr:Type 1 glutamine amidotransferase-like domain-containing protein [Microbacteriaceae bacterium VKM Ac-2855]
MSVHLVGGGRDPETDAQVFGAFLAEATQRAENAGRFDGPRLAIVLVHDGLGPEYYDGYVRAMTSLAAIEPVPVLAPEGSFIRPESFEDIDGVFVGGGSTPAYRDALAGSFERLRELVASGVPYLGYSAGAAIAPDRALVGGYRIGGVGVSPDSAAEELDEVTVLEGIGLIDVSVDVHAAQWGTLSRLVAATEAGLIDGGVAIDEATVLIVGTGALQVRGSGSVWKVTGSAAGVTVGTLAAS